MTRTRAKLLSTFALTLAVGAAGCSGSDQGEPGSVDTLTLAACSGLTLSSSPASPQDPGTSVLLTAGGTTCGGSETPEYRFAYRQDGTAGPYIDIQGYSTSATANWNTTGLPSGKYSLIVYVRAVGSGAAYQDVRYGTYLLNPACTSTTLNTTPAPPQSPGTLVSLSSNGTCTGGATPEFRYFYRRTGDPSYTEIRGFGPSPATWDTTGLSGGTYTLLVYVRAVGNVSNFEATAYRTYTLGDSCGPATLGAAPPSPSPVGTAVGLTGSAPCTGSATPEYRFYYTSSGSGWTLIQDWNGATATWATGALAAGSYNLRVDVRAVQNGGAPESTGYLPYTLTAVAQYGSVAAGQGYHACGTASDGTARCWGSNSDGQLGDGTTTNRSTPVAVTGLTSVSQLAVGGFHTCGLRTDGTVACWGSNTDGQLGDGTTTDSTTPVAVAGLTGATAITAGTYHTCARRSDATIVCWGDNSFGQIGNGAATGDVLTPTAPTGVTSASVVSAGGWHTCAVSGTTAYCWGNNDFGQIGIGSTNPKEPTPTAVTLTNVKGVAAGDSHTCALRTPTDIRCWGLNDYGQIGNNTTTNSNVPVQPQSQAPYSAISAGFVNTCGLRTDGTLRCWGNNDFGQIGDGTTTQRLVPTVVTGLSGATHVASAGGLFSCARLSGGTARCWGYNAEGSLGDGTTTDSSSPVVVLGP